MKLKALPATHWLLPEERAEVVRELLGFGLIKCDNNRRLPLKMGGYTDIYVNLRDARSNPRSIQFLADVYALALRRLSVDRFIEIPDAVSCFAGPLSVRTDLPYLTVRETPKTGRVTNARIIGDSRPGERVVIIDDVMTDGASKITPIMECRRLNLDLMGLVILVDRQQGWREQFAAKNLQTNVWAGMTLHDIRQQLVASGYIERCASDLEENNPLIVALDGGTWEDYLPLLDQLRTLGCIFKVNDLAFAEGVDGVLPKLSAYGRAMVDLKLHDIPSTVANICAHLRPHDPWAVTVHASGGGEMVAAAVKALHGTSTKVLAVTVLTSIDPATCREIYHRIPPTQVMELARMASDKGAHGFVCSAEETPMLRKAFPNALIVNPGIRSPGVIVSDQKRVGTPVNAINAGANHLVMGRQITCAPDPVLEVKRLLSEELELPQFAKA